MKLKKLFAGLISLAAALLAVCAITMCAGAQTSGGYEYSVLDDGTVEIGGYDGKDTNLVIPSIIDGKKSQVYAHLLFRIVQALLQSSYPTA